MAEENSTLPPVEAPAEASPETSARPAASLASTVMRGDLMLWGIYILLVIISVVEMFSASSTLAYKAASTSDPVFRHIRHLLVGFGLIILFQNASRVAIRQWGRLFYAAGVLLLLLLPSLGTDMKGAHRDIFGIQPVELIKVGVMMVLCELITTSDVTYQRFNAFFRRKTDLRRYCLLLLVIALVCVPIALQNLSSALIVAFASLGLMFLGEVRGKYLLYTIGVVAVAATLAVAALFWLHEVNESRHEQGQTSLALGPLERANTWSSRLFGNNEDVPLWQADTDGDKAQEVFAHMALANSYPFGRLFGNSRLRDFLPEAFSDYIFAIIFEELGFIGASVVLLLYLLLLWRGYQLSRRTENVYIRLLMVSLPLIMVIQALIHIGVCTGAMFVTGQPLPLISRGGSSIVFTSISFGLMFALSRIIETEEKERQQAQLSFNP